MNDYRHHFSGFFAYREAAQLAVYGLIAQGMPSAQIQTFKSDSPQAQVAPVTDSNAVLKTMLVGGAIGTAVGTGMGAIAELALLLADISLFVASPLIAPLVMMGWGASLGALAGLTTGAMTDSDAAVKRANGRLSDLVRDAISVGQVVLLVQTRTPQETVIAKEVIQASVGDFKDVAVA